ncbi:Predicted PurR-regulated permease PerM [Rhodoblastus acidophilus]|uniref:Predicted PurR-regulated permease PerM n=1 Tax=Rhodoblastus acidophilus TaxID=1074 RepID=A0A212RQJ2_RHOAC|nr:AI-2E family transporter [Rhodoblastus acidophilus]MCW2316199.1 putative PurR-regulated permease PerM [Rhodoblastus acidophilus]PPQ38544.1 AI-2E family transporter [Rhodoblastus acidophilus]RAI21857.1 AI-2E family transporter [Rhodoblastus acidophilus]SNB74825.1 Predicted PurR-regulated permease PerM [Rhodoblastus acidophilus]
MLDHPDKPRIDADADDGLARLSQYAAIGLFALSALAVLKLAADVMVPIFAAILIGSVLAQVAERLSGLGLPSPAANFLVVVGAIAVGLLLIAGLIEPFSGLLARAPEMARAVTALADPLAQRWSHLQNELGQAQAQAGAASPGIGDAMSWATSFLGRLTPALEQMLIFFPCLVFFVAGRQAMRAQMVLAMPERSSRLSTLRGIVAVERALAHYFATTAMVYAAIGVITGIIAAGFGLAQPLLWAAMTFAAAYIPYLGVALITLALAVGGLLTHSHSLFALAPAALYLGVHLFGEMAIIPTLLGRRYEINPFVIFLSIVFWSWMWGPVGAILAVPLLLTAQTLLDATAEPEKPLP